jgi:hypothetical protein
MAGPFGKSVLDDKFPFRVEALSEEHNRTTFRCGVEALDRYFREQIMQDMRRRISNCFVAVDSATDDLAGFYTLATSSILYQELPQHITKRLPRYRSIPAILLGRLAVDRVIVAEILVPHCLEMPYRALHALMRLRSHCWSMPRTKAPLIFIESMASKNWQIVR